MNRQRCPQNRFWRVAEEFLEGESHTTAGRVASALFWLIIGGSIYLVVIHTAGYH